MSVPSVADMRGDGSPTDLTKLRPLGCGRSEVGLDLQALGVTWAAIRSARRLAILYEYPLRT